MNAYLLELHNVAYAVLKNLPGQRLGARAWYWHFREFATTTLSFSWSSIQPCIAKCGPNVFMVHVDDLLFIRNFVIWLDVFLPAMQEKFSVSFNVLGGEGTEITFLKRRLVRLQDGLMVVPGTTVEKVLSAFEQFFGHAKLQKTPCDDGINNRTCHRNLG